jgi:hypothetical protein
MTDTDTQVETLPDIIARLGIKAKVSPGTTMQVAKMDDWHLSAYQYTVKLTYKGRSLTTPFFTGKAWNREPNAADVLSSLVSDTGAGEMTFEEYCSEFGLDRDSRKAFTTWKACVQVAGKVRRFLGVDFKAVDEAAREY